MTVQIQLLLRNQTKEKKDRNIYLIQHLIQVVKEFSKNDISLFFLTLYSLLDHQI